MKPSLNDLLIAKAQTARVEAAIRERFEFTGNRRDRVRRSAVYAVVATATDLVVSPALASRTMAMCRELGAIPIRPFNARWFARMRAKDEQLVPTPGMSLAQLKRAWYARLAAEDLDEEPGGKLRELPRFQAYRAEINGAFFERVQADFWRQFRELEAWRLYALEGLSVRDVAARCDLSKDVVQRIVTQKRAALERHRAADQETGHED